MLNFEFGRETSFCRALAHRDPPSMNIYTPHLLAFVDFRRFFDRSLRDIRARPSVEKKPRHLYYIIIFLPAYSRRETSRKTIDKQREKHRKTDAFQISNRLENSKIFLLELMIRGKPFAINFLSIL